MYAPRILACAWNGLLVVLSLAAGLAVCEAALRLADTLYEQAAEPPVRRYAWRNRLPHPDAKTEHDVLYNRLGNRQQRDFSERDFEHGIHVAFFGDSFTEGLDIPVQYTFAEVLDHLLNAKRDGAAPTTGRARGARPPHFHVHNFGEAGTGPGSQYLRYHNFAHKDRLRHVLYVFWHNDFSDLRHSGLYALDATGDLVRRMRQPTPVWIRFLSGLRLTYLALDVWQRLTGTDDAVPSPAVIDGDFVAEALLSRWREETEANGGAFHVVLLPEPLQAYRFRQRVRPRLFDVLDLRDCFEQEIPGFVWKDWVFRSDFHWNEAGHMVAAHCLYRFLESRLGLARAPDKALAQARHTYYRAFADDASWPGHRFMPAAPWALPAPGPLNAAEAARIRAKHLALQTDGEGPRRRIVREVRRGEPHARKGGWAVYASPRHRMVVYVKSPCAKGGNHPGGRLFLHMGESKVKRFEGTAGFWRDGDGDCVVALPMGYNAAVAKVRTGEWAGEPGGAVLWAVEFPFDPAERAPAVTAAYRREYEAMAERPALARRVGNWSAHVLDDRIAFLKRPCHASDLRGRFSLRMYPADPADVAHELNAGALALRSHRSSQLERVRVDRKCLLRVALPPWPVATISARQENGEAVLWETTFHVNVERHRRAWAAVRFGAPAARATFDIYRHGAELVYVREPCDEGDGAARFFLHVVAGAARTNLDFDFIVHGVADDGRCVALARLPAQDIDRIRTGQFVAGEGELWSVELQRASGER